MVSAFLASLLVGAPVLALEPTALGLDQVTPERLSPDSSPASGLADLPALYLYNAPQASSKGKTPGLMVYGGRVAVGDGRLALTSDLYFGKTVRLADMLEAHGGGAAGAPSVLGMSSTADRHYTLKQGRALSQDLAYQSRAFSLSGSYTSVDADFQGLSDLVAQRPDVKDLKDALGMETLNLEGALRPSSALGLKTSLNRVVNDKPGHKERGLTTTHMVHNLDLKPSQRFNLTGAWDGTDWEGKKEGSLHDLKLGGQFKPTDRMAFNTSYHKLADDKPGSKKRGQTVTKTHYDLVYALSGRTGFTAAYDTVEDVWNKPDKHSVKDTATTTLGLAHQFGGGTGLKFGRQLISATTDGKALDTTIDSLHVEHKPGGRFGLTSDITRKATSDGSVDNVTAFKLNSAFGSGRSASSLTGEWKRRASGQAGAQNDTLTKLNLKSSGSQALQLNIDYTGDRRDGPSTKKNYTKTVTSLTSRLTGEAAVTATLLRESNLGQRLTSERTLKFDYTPSLLRLNSTYHTVEREGGKDEREVATDLFLELGKPMREWAQQASKKGVLDGIERYGVMSLPGWSDMPQGGITYQMIQRDQSEGEAPTTKRIGYQTMVGPSAYLRLGMQQYPLKKKGKKITILPLEEQMLEGGLKIGGRFNLLARRLARRDLDKGGGTDTSLLALRGAIGGSDKFAFASGVQRAQPRDDGPASRLTFADLQAKLGAPLADWAKQASNKGLFDDHKSYGHRDLPGWAKFTDGGVHLQFVSRSGDDKPSLATYLAGAQTMVGKRMYLRASLEQNPLNKKNKLVPGRRTLYEAGLRFGGKFTALARLLSERDDAKQRALRSHYFGLRGRLSARERLEAILVFDKATFQGARHSASTYGLEYARELNEDHFLTLKGTMTHDGDPSKAAEKRKAYRFDLGFKKAI